MKMKIHQCSHDSSVGAWWPCASQAYSMTRGERQLSRNSVAGFRGLKESECTSVVSWMLE